MYSTELAAGLGRTRTRPWTVRGHHWKGRRFRRRRPVDMPVVRVEGGGAGGGIVVEPPVRFTEDRPHSPVFDPVIWGIEDEIAEELSKKEKAEVERIVQPGWPLWVYFAIGAGVATVGGLALTFARR